jgi:hypothetical protein
MKQLIVLIGAVCIASTIHVTTRAKAERGEGAPAERVRGAGAPGADYDVTGKWLFSVETDAGTGTPTVTLKQDGEKLTGHYSSANLGEADLSGSVKGQDITFTFSANAQGTSLQVTYTGKIENKDSLKGTVDLGGMAQGTFTAKRQ